MTNNNQASAILNAFESISLYSSVFKNRPGTAAHNLFSSLAAEGGSLQVKKLSARLFEELAAAAEQSAFPQAGSLWQNYLIDQIITSENTFTRMASGGRLKGGEHPAGLIKAAAGADLENLRILFDIDFIDVILPANTGDCLHLDLIGREGPVSAAAPPPGTPRSLILDLKINLLQNPDWGSLVELLADFHLRCGCGLFCSHYALRWDGVNKMLTGIPHTDPVRLEDLVGYNDERSKIIKNTERLLAGLPAGNILLYGDRGTGKSSTVKALINRYGSGGLRMVDLPRQFLNDYHLLLSSLGGTSLKFIIFIDDLSFEENETDYKALKSMLDGNLQAAPENAVIYATSNRRHLVREYFDERRNEVGNTDTLQEKLSLSDRFGTTVLFVSPDRDLYLNIVESLARQRGIDIPADNLRVRALEWERWNNSRSGRTARQFVDQLVGQHHYFDL